MTQLHAGARTSTQAPGRGIGAAHAKAILVGEHAVVYGYPAIAFPLPRLRISATAEQAERPGLTCLDYSGPMGAAPAALRGIVLAIEAALMAVGHPDAALRVVTRSDVPAGRGLGSSAAAAAAVVRAVFDAFGRVPTPRELFDLTQVSERVAHGHPSGLDAAASAAAGPIYFRAGRARPLGFPLSAPIVVADSGRPSGTLASVESVRRLYRSAPQRVRACLRDLGSLAESTVRFLAGGDLASLGGAMNAAHSLLRQIGVSDAALDALVGAARRAGALGAKLTGGGNGGCVIALARDGADARMVSAALRAAGACRTWVCAPGRAA